MEMALRSKTNTLSGLGLNLAALLLYGAIAPLASAQSYTFVVRHQHWRNGVMGTLRISPAGISFEEHGSKGQTDSRSWRYEEVQQLTISPSELRILTYEDSKWKLGRDREYTFDRVPK